jgi:cytochrome c oxidase assembly factor 1
LGITGWAGFLLVATNQEKLSSSIVRQILRTVRDNPELKELLGSAIRPEPTWILNGDPWINGKVCSFAGFRLWGW